MISQEYPDVFIRIYESNQSGSPTCWCMNIKEGKNCNLNHNQPKEDYVNELYHFS